MSIGSFVNSIKAASPASSGKVVGRASSRKARGSASEKDTSEASLESEENSNQLASLVNPEGSQSANSFGGEDKNVLEDPTNSTEENLAASGETDPSFNASTGTLLTQAGQGEITGKDSNVSTESTELENPSTSSSIRDKFPESISRLYDPYFTAEEKIDKEKLEGVRQLLKEWNSKLDPKLVLRMSEVTEFSIPTVINDFENVKEDYEKIESERLFKKSQILKEFYNSLPLTRSFEDLQYLSAFDSFVKVVGNANKVSTWNYKKSELGNKLYEKDNWSPEEIEAIKREAKSLNANIFIHQGSDSLPNIALSSVVDTQQEFDRVKTEVGLAFFTGAVAASETGPGALPAGLATAGFSYKVASARDAWEVQRGSMVINLVLGGVKVEIAKRVADGAALLIAGFGMVPGGVATKRLGKATKDYLVDRFKKYMISPKGKRARKVLKEITMGTLEDAEKAGAGKLIEILGEDAAIILGTNKEGALAKRGTSFSSKENFLNAVRRGFKAIGDSLKKSAATKGFTVPAKNTFKTELNKIRSSSSKKSKADSEFDEKADTPGERIQRINEYNFQVTLREIIKVSKFQEKYPQKFQEYIQDLSDEYGLDSVYIKGERFKKFLGENEQAKQHFENNLPDLAEELETMKQGQTLELPFVYYLNHFILEGKLIKDVRLSSNSERTELQPSLKIELKLDAENKNRQLKPNK